MLANIIILNEKAPGAHKTKRLVHIACVYCNVTELVSRPFISTSLFTATTTGRTLSGWVLDPQ